MSLNGRLMDEIGDLNDRADEQDEVIKQLMADLDGRDAYDSDVRGHVLRVTHRCAERVTAEDAARVELDCTASICLHRLPCPVHPAETCERNSAAIGATLTRRERIAELEAFRDSSDRACRACRGAYGKDGERARRRIAELEGQIGEMAERFREKIEDYIVADRERRRFATERGEARGDLERLRDEISRSPVGTSGKHLGAVRRWIQWNCRNGERVTWGTADELDHRFTVQDLEELAERVREALEPPTE